MSDPLEIAILKERIKSLEAVLETWLDKPLEQGRGEQHAQ
jgi:hypothetical protein